MYRLANFNLMGNIAARMLPDDPAKVIEIAQNLGKVKNRVAPTKAAPGFLGGIDKLAGDIGAGVGVMTAAGGAGINKMLGANTNIGGKLKQMGVNTVLDGGKSKLLGRGLLGTGAAAIGGTGLGVKGYIDKNMEQTPEELMGNTNAETAQNWLAYKNANGGFKHKRYATFAMPKLGMMGNGGLLGAGIGGVMAQGEIDPATGLRKSSNLGDRFKGALVGGTLGAGAGYGASKLQGLGKGLGKSLPESKSPPALPQSLDGWGQPPINYGAPKDYSSVNVNKDNWGPPIIQKQLKSAAPPDSSSIVRYTGRP